MIAIGKGECGPLPPRAADRRPGGGRRRLTWPAPAGAVRRRAVGRRPRRPLPSAAWTTPPGRSSRSGSSCSARSPPAGSPGASALPAVVGYLALGIVVSPFTPGYVADRDQLQLLADLGVVLLLFEVGIEVDLLRIRSRAARADRRRAAPDARSRPRSPAAVLFVAGLAPIPAALIGLSVALSSSVVIVNITKSRRRTTDRATEEALLGWSALQDSDRRGDRGGPPRPARQSAGGRSTRRRSGWSRSSSWRSRSPGSCRSSCARSAPSTTCS